MEEETSFIEEVEEHSEEELDECEGLNLPDMTFTDEEMPVDPSKISWPPRPNIADLGVYYDEMKEFILDDSKMELIYPPMDGTKRKLIHTIADLFSLKSKSYGNRKKNRHVRVYKYDDIPQKVNLTSRDIAEANFNPRTKDLKIPIFIKESPIEVLEESIISTV